MNTLEDLNRAVNRALRALNHLAVSAPVTQGLDVSVALREITSALAHLDAFQRLIVTADPALEYHYDPNRPPSQFMKAVADLVERAEGHIAQGDFRAAKELLLRAQDMEPAPLVYEMIEKRIESLQEE